VKPSLAAPLAAGLTALAGLAVLAGLAAPAAAATSGPRAATAATAGAIKAEAAAAGPGHPVVVIGIPGLRWTDITRSTTPALWRLAEQGSVGSLVVSGVDAFSCPADAWLTLNSGARAIAPRTGSGACEQLPAVTSGGAPGAGPARVPAMTGSGGLEHYNRQFFYHPPWGLLARAAGPGGCATAIGPGGALALASRSGNVARYETRSDDRPSFGSKKCRLTVADAGALPATGTPGVRRAALQSADRAAARVIAAAPAGAIVAVAGLGDDSAPHLRAIIVSGPGYSRGLLRAASARQPGLVLLTDLTPSVFRWRGLAIPAAASPNVVGSPVTANPRGSLASAIRSLTGQDTAAQVYRHTLAPFFLIYGFGEGVLFALITLIFWGASAERRRRRYAAYRVVGVSAAAVAPGSFLASLAPWPVLPHPALLLYGLGLAWAAVIAAIALTGPWRRDPLGPPGFIGAATIAVIGLDVITGSHLQLGTPFGLSALAAGRFYGIGNNAVGTYALGGLLAAAWAGSATQRRTGSRGRAVAAAAAVTLFTVVAAGWPQFGAKVGGTIAMLPGFLVLLAGLAGVRITPRRAAIVAISGVLVIALFGVLNFLFPAVTGASDIGAFVGRLLHGGATGILQRKVHANVSSLTANRATPIIPVVVAVTGVLLAWPDRLRLHAAAAAMRAEPLLRPLLTAMWLVAVLAWLVNDSGVTVTASLLPFALPLVIAIVTGFSARQSPGMPDVGGNARTAPAGPRRANL